jgi:hypothetical protein
MPIGVSTSLTLTPLDERGTELLDELERAHTPPFLWDDRTGARSYWINAQARRKMATTPPSTG